MQRLRSRGSCTLDERSIVVGALASNCTVLSLGMDQEHLLILHRYFLHPWRAQDKKPNEKINVASVATFIQRVVYASQTKCCDVLPIFQLRLLTHDCRHFALFIVSCLFVLTHPEAARHGMLRKAVGARGLDYTAALCFSQTHRDHVSQIFILLKAQFKPYYVSAPCVFTLTIPGRTGAGVAPTELWLQPGITWKEVQNVENNVMEAASLLISLD